MAGIYVHIPFCRRACHYCDFHFTTNLKNPSLLVDAILQEIELRKHYLQGESLSTIYFGGGTPSLLQTSDIERIINAINRTHTIERDVELTLEANPEDLTEEKLQELKTVGVNRLSLGTQSFIDAELKWMNRMHSADQALSAIKNAQNIGFDNISIDLIFGLPDQTEQNWQVNLDQAVALEVQHISSYSLTIEPKTVLNNRIQKGEEKLPDENEAAKHFEMNMEFFPASGFEHYEISNFAKEGFISRHNSSYWLGAKYLGLGPSAHSFNGIERSWNIRSNGAYIQKIQGSESYFESEELTKQDRINEHIMTGLRTKWGIQKNILEEIEINSWGKLMELVSEANKNDFIIEVDRLLLSPAGKLKADQLSAMLFTE